MKILSRIRGISVAAALAMAAWTTIAAEPAKREGPLAALPSADGPHIEKIQALPEGGWLNLGAPAPDPQWGRARGRAWACRMPYAPELRGAFLTGEGVHGFVKPDGHVMDDWWFYDVPQHRWICLYPGSDVTHLELKVNADGFEADASGMPVPLSQIAHAYENITYDSDAHRLMAMPSPNYDYLAKALKRRREQWLAGQNVNRTKASPWFYESDRGKWNRLVTGMTNLRSSYGDSFHYLPGQKRAFFRHGEEVWFYDTAANTWTQVHPNGPALPFGIDATSCYDPKRERIYIGGGSYPVTPAGANALWIYDLHTNAWIDPKPTGAPCHGSNAYNTNVSAMAYDGPSDTVIVFRYGGEKAERGIFLYSPSANTWTEAAARFPEKWGQCINAFYDPVLKVYFFHVAGDSDDNGTIWVYRHKAM